MRGRAVLGGTSPRLALEVATAGLAYGAGLCWASVCLVASFRPGELSVPYWHGLPGLRTDTCGIVAFVMVAVCFGTSDYLRLCRRRDASAGPSRGLLGGTAQPLALAVANMTAILATGLVVYLSVNAVTHPATLGLRATHLVAWPTEGTLRVMALLLSVVSIAARRYLLAGPSGGAAASRCTPCGEDRVTAAQPRG
jgi:hypothetical protein